MKTPPVIDRLICWTNKEPILTVRNWHMPIDIFMVHCSYPYARLSRTNCKSGRSISHMAATIELTTQAALYGG